MAEIVRMPKLSDTMTEGVVSKWHKKIGDKVKNGELLADIETDKATMEFESFQEGVLLYRGVEEGQATKVDSILAILGKSGENIEDILQKEKTATPQEQAIKTEEKQLKQEPTKAEPIKQEISTIQNQIKEVELPNKSLESGFIKISPLAKKLAKEKNINLQHIKGSGDGGRIIKRDIDQATSISSANYSIASVEKFTEIPVSQMRKTIARRLSESKFSAPHFYLTMDIDMDELMKVRSVINEVSSQKISFNDIIIKAVAHALTKHKAVNSSWLGDTIRINEHVHIGVAIAVEDGLVVPVVKFANSKTLSQIASEIKSFAEKASTKKLQPNDFIGNTFTISNLGMFGIEEFTAIINTPDSCILAVGAIRELPVSKNGHIVLGNRMKVTLSCDHRVVDGASGAKFLQTLKKYLENPVLLLGEYSI